jgi:phage gp36-like protein
MAAVSYATVDQMSDYVGADELVRLSDRNGDGETDIGVVEAAVADASSIADSYLARWLPIEEANVPAVLRRHVMAIAVYSLANNTETDDQRKRFEDAMQWLRDVSKGVASLGIPPAVDDPSAVLGVPTYHTACRVMSRNSLRGVW